MLRAAAAALPETDGVQSITITLAAQQLTDQLSFAWINPAEIMEQVRGQYLDYKFDMRIEETTQNGILTTCQCCSDIDELLYTQTSYTLGRGVFQGGLYYDKSKYSAKAAADARHEAIKKAHSAASAHIMKIAEFLGKQVVLAYDDFVSSIDTDEGGVTYGDLIRDIFGWTSRLPQMLINCYIRNDTLYVIQRGYESNVIDLSATKHTVPVINKKIMRTTWGSTPGTETVFGEETSPQLGGKIPDKPTEIDEPDNPDEPKIGNWAAKDLLLLSIRESTQGTDDKKTADYTYGSFDIEGQNFITQTYEKGKRIEDTRTIKTNKYDFDMWIIRLQLTHKFDGTSGSTTTATPYTDELTPFERRKNADIGLSKMQDDDDTQSPALRKMRLNLP